MNTVFLDFYKTKHTEFLGKYLNEIQCGDVKKALGFLQESNTYLKEFNKLNKEN